MRIRPQNAPNTDSRNRLAMHDRVRVVSIGVQGLPGPHTIDGAFDVSAAEDGVNTKVDGSLLEFNDNTKKYHHTKTPRNITFNCGNF